MYPLRSGTAPLLVFLLLTLALGGPLAAQTRTVELVATDAMKFDTTTIEARPGETLRVVVRSTGQMPKIAMAHNFVLLQPGTDPASFANEGAMHRGSDFIAPGLAGRVIAKTPMGGAGETVEVTLTAPGPGSYPFVCSFPGHAVAGMQGTLVVR
jgi:azurin